MASRAKGAAASQVFVFAHGTSLEYARNIMATGLNEAEAASRSLRGAGSQPGSFHAFEAAHIQIAYELGLRHTEKAKVLLGTLPTAIIDELVKRGLIRFEELIGSPAGVPPQIVFTPASFETVNAAVRWELLDPEEGA